MRIYGYINLWEVWNKMEDKKGGDLICRRPETIIEARFKLTKRQNDILDMVFASIEDDNKLKYQIDITKYGQLYKIKDKSNIYRDLKKAVKTFECKGFSISTKNEKNKEHRIYFSWFSTIEYIDGESKIVLELGQSLKGLMLSAKKACFYQIKYPLNFHNIYSKRLYYYLKSYENSNNNGTGWRIDNLDELRTKLECPKSYNVYYEFKRFVLKQAYEEINGSSDISFEFEEIKTKGKVTSIKFIIIQNKVRNEIAITSKEIEENPQQDLDLVKQVQAIFTRHTITEHEASCIINDANNNIDLIKQCYKYLLTKDKVDNVVGYTRTLVRGFNEPQVNIKTDSFNDFPQRNYDFDALEKGLLGWE